MLQVKENRVRLWAGEQRPTLAQVALRLRARQLDFIDEFLGDDRTLVPATRTTRRFATAARFWT